MIGTRGKATNVCGMETVGTGLACFVQTMRLVGEWEKGRVEVDIGCSYGAVNASGTGDKPRSRRTLASVVCLLA